MTTPENIISITQEIKLLIKKSERFVKEAWRAGELILQVKNGKKYQNPPLNFETYKEYVDKTLKMTTSTANKFIRLRNFFESPDSIPPDILLSHIDYILTSGLNDSTAHYLIREISSIPKSLMRQGFVNYLTNMCISANYCHESLETEDNIHEEIKKITSNKELRDDFFRPKKAPKMGPILINQHLVNECFQREPVNEMGVVAIFCCMFNNIKNHNFQDGEHTLRLQSIRSIQSAFPDAVLLVELEEPGKSYFSDYNVEFEYESDNYFRHGHHLQPQACQLIICWKNNIKNNNCPPILELKNFFTQEDSNPFVIQNSFRWGQKKKKN